MPALRPVAAVVGIATAVWGVFLGFYWRGPVDFLVGHETRPVVSNEVILVVSVTLLVISHICLLGPRVLFYVPAGLSAVLAVAVYGAGVSGSGLLFVVTMALCAGTVALGLLAARKRAGLSEENHPLNLPVFG